MKVRFAVSPPSSALGPDSFPAYLEAVETLGFDTVWLSDIPLGELGDPLISLAFAAAHTKKLKLGANLVPLGRHPLWFAKQLAQIDSLSNGRLLVSFVPGLGQPAERQALGYPDENRAHVIDEMIELMRRWWTGERVSTQWRGLHFDDVGLHPLPMQEPLEVWLGGHSKAAIERVAAIADGWLTSATTPAEAGAGRRRIEARAQELGRQVDADHFGISIPYSVDDPEEASLSTLRKRRKDRDLSEVVAVGENGLCELAKAHIDVGLTKFVVRSLSGLTGDSPWQDDLKWLADAVLPLQN